MKSLEQFKLEHNISKIDLLQGKGRMFAQVGNIDIVVSKNCDLSQPLFVIPTKDPDTQEVRAGLFTIINSSTVSIAASI